MINSNKDKFDSFYDTIKPYFVALMILLMYSMIVYVSYRDTVTSNGYDAQQDTFEDFSVLIKGLPYKRTDIVSSKSVYEVLEESIDKAGYRVAAINFVYDSEEYTTIQQKYQTYKSEQSKKKWTDQHKAKLEKESQNPFLLEQLPLLTNANIVDDLILKAMEEEEANFDQGNPEKMTGQAFVSFVTKDDRNRFLENYKKRGVFQKWFGCLGF
jgi:hypothetical protein